MRGKTPRVLVALVLAHAGAAGAAAQGVEGDLSGLAVENARLFVQPLSQGLGLAMASGLLDGAEPLGQLGFDVGVRVTGALPPLEAETFGAVLPTSVEWDGQSYSNPLAPQGGSTSTPTAVGDGPGVVLEPTGSFRTALVSAGENPSDFEVRFPDGLDVPAIPFTVIHASLGLGFGTDVSLRFIPEVKVDEEIGGVRALGLVGRHEVSHWLGAAAPVDLSVVLGIQRLDVGDYLEASSTQYGVLVGRGWGPLSLFLSGIGRTASVDVDYAVENEGDNPALPPDGLRISFSEELDSGVALGAGARLSLLFMNLTGQYVFDDYDSFSIKVGFGLGRR